MLAFVTVQLFLCGVLRDDAGERVVEQGSCSPGRRMSLDRIGFEKFEKI